VSDSFPTSRFIEKLKLGDKAQGAGKSVINVPLSFTEDRALTAVQLLLAEQSFGEIENLPMTPKAQEMWRWEKGVPVLYTTPAEYSLAYLQHEAPPKQVNARALNALKAIADKVYCLPMPGTAGDPAYEVSSTLIDVQKYIVTGKKRPVHLRISLSPAVFAGVYPTLSSFVHKPRNLYGHLDKALGPGSGKRPTMLPRLIAWLITYSTDAGPSIEVSETRIAERLGSQVFDFKSEQSNKFRKALSHYFEVVQAVGLIKAFEIPDEGDKKWRVVLAKQA
jgi:hypothetical protein